MTARLENWSVTACWYSAPELGRTYLQGTVFGHPKKEDGKVVITSRVLSVEDKTVQTRNTTYELGTVDPDYVVWMEDNGIEFDPENPIKMKTQ